MRLFIVFFFFLQNSHVKVYVHLLFSIRLRRLIGSELENTGGPSVYVAFQLQSTDCGSNLLLFPQWQNDRALSLWQFFCNMNHYCSHFATADTVVQWLAHWSCVWISLGVEIFLQKKKIDAKKFYRKRPPHDNEYKAQRTN